MKQVNGSLLSLMVLVLAGCHDNNDLVAFVDEVSKRPAGQIEPLPPVKIYENYVYSSDALRSPFQPPGPEMNKGKKGGGGPDMNHQKEPLEAYPLDALKLVGVLHKQGRVWALIIDKNGMVHRLTIGHYLGQNYGKINKILEDKVELTEMVADSQGRWQARPVTINLLQ